jgi:thiamine biosynthesis lipoprotein
MEMTRLVMGMPVTVNILADKSVTSDLEKVFAYFTYVDNKFSTYKGDSEISRINQGLLKIADSSQDMREVLDLCERTKKATGGYFEINNFGTLDPSGLVKGWAIKNAAKLIKKLGVKNFYINAGGDIQVGGRNENNQKWRIGIENPFNRKEIVKAVCVDNEGVATSGTYIRGQHVYDPHHPGHAITEIVSLTVIGPDVYEADRFATADFAMGLKGLEFIAGLKGFAGYMIDKDKISHETPDFAAYVLND